MLKSCLWTVNADAQLLALVWIIPAFSCSSRACLTFFFKWNGRVRLYMKLADDSDLSVRCGMLGREFFHGVNSVIDFADPLSNLGSSNARFSSILGSSALSPVLTDAINPSTLAFVDVLPTSGLKEYIKSPGRDSFLFSSTLRQISEPFCTALTIVGNSFIFSRIFADISWTVFSIFFKTRLSLGILEA